MAAAVAAVQSSVEADDEAALLAYFKDTANFLVNHN